MITQDILNNDPVLKELSDEVKAAIATLSENDERATINAKYSELLNGFDEMVKEVTGKGKNTNEKTSDYIKRSLSDSLSQVTSLTEDNGKKSDEIKQLQEQIAAGSADKTLLAAKDATIADLQAKYAELEKKSKDAKADYAKQLTNYRINAEIGAAVNGISIKEGLSAEAVAALKRQAIADVLGKNPSYEKNAQGEEVLVFHGADGQELRNPSNQLNLFTAQELLSESFAKFGILDDGQGGGGAGGGGSKPKPSTLLAGAKSKVEFNQIAHEQIAAKGIAYGTDAWDEAYMAIRKDNPNYDTLPMQ